jgi:hypothetical protein
VYYINTSTPDAEKNLDDMHTNRSREISTLQDEVMVQYNGELYRGSAATHALIATNMLLLAVSPAGTTRSFLTAAGKPVELSKDDFSVLLSLIDAQHKNISNSLIAEDQAR